MSDPVEARMNAVPGKVEAGATFKILVELEIAGAYHLYASNAVGKPFVPVALDLTLPRGVEAIGDWAAPPPVRARNDDLLYTDSVVFRRSLRVGSNVPSGTVSIQCELRYQACTDELCWPPRTLKRSASLDVGSAKR